MNGWSPEVWWVRPEDVRSRHAQLLDAAESGRLRSMRRREDRRRFVAGCAVLRLVLSARLGVAPRSVPLDRTCPVCGARHGRPRLPSGRPHLSVSHSGALVSVALAECAPVGVDVERVDPALNVKELAARVLAEPEITHLSPLPADELPAAFFTYWTRKEAVLKATGDGLAVEPSSVHVSAPGHPPRLVSFAGRPQLAREASMTDLSPGKGYVSTVCVLHTAPGPIRQFDAGPLLRGSS
jgi:4'-phosphopantetheinyl transferase